MPEIRSRAIVLRTFDQGESDRLVHLYTERTGRVSAIAKGARRSKRRFPGTLELFSLLDVRIVDPPRSTLMRVEAATLVDPFEGIGADLGRYAISCQLVELLDRFTGEREDNPDLFRFAAGVLGVVAAETSDRLLALLVLTKTLGRLGYRPILLRCAVCAAPLAPSEGVVSPAGRRPAFVPAQGGAVCASCCEPHAAEVGPELLIALEGGIRSPLLDRAKFDPGPAGVARLERLIDRFCLFHLGFELRTAPFLRVALGARTRLDAPGPPGDTAPARDRGGGPSAPSRGCA